MFGIVCYEAKCEAAEATGETDETERMIRDAISAGYRFFLTDVKTEEILGEVVDSCCIPREDFFISAKCESDSLNDEEMAKGLECARANLKMEYVDLFTVKWPKIDSTSSEKRTWKQMAKELDSGRVRAISCLELSEQQLKSFIQIEGIRPTAIQLDFSSLTWKIIRYCKENQICVLARGPEKEDLDGLIDNLQLNELTQKYQKEIIQIFWRFLLQQGMILLVNLSDLNAMQDQPGISDFILTDEEIGVISNVIK